MTAQRLLSANEGIGPLNGGSRLQIGWPTPRGSLSPWIALATRFAAVTPQ